MKKGLDLRFPHRVYVCALGFRVFRAGIDRRRNSHTRAARTAAAIDRLAPRSGGSRCRGCRGCMSLSRSSQTHTCKVAVSAKWLLEQSGARTSDRRKSREVSACVL